MSSIRPIITLTIIVIAGVFLFQQINSGPAELPHGGTETVDATTATGAPPLAATTPGVSSPTPAPTWSGGTVATEPAAPKWADTVSENATESTPPGTPPIPALPPLADATIPATPTTPAMPTAPEAPTMPATSLDPPASVPVARYSADETSTTAPAVPTNSAYDTTASTAAPTTESATAAVPQDERYATPIPEVSPLATSPAPVPPPSPLAASWPEIQTALDKQELAQAHKMLSEFYGNPALSADESQQVEALLSQLAGSVVYSTEHRLEPPYVVHAGDTLESIAAKYEVPWQLLAKINGIPAADLVQTGQELKVIHGPFSAVVELSKGQLTLLLGDRYAGRFPVMTETGATMSEGEWTLEQKLVNPPSGGVVTASYESATPTVDRILVLRKQSPSPASETISIASSTVPASGATAVAPAAIRVTPQDAEELSDILSVGSRIVIRR
jgi:LysM repeat protein